MVGLGPVFAFEWAMASRRWQGYALRAMAVGLVLVAMVPIWVEEAPDGVLAIREQAAAGRAFAQRAGILLLGLVGFVAPAATAGALCLDKARGNLTLLFATDLSDAEIILGKLAARLVPVVGLILCVTPVLALSTLFGGLDPLAVLGTLLVVLSCAVFGCALALTLSVWGKKTHEVLMATYVFGIAYLLLAPFFALLPTMLPAGWRVGWLPTFYQLLPYNPVFLALATFGSPPSIFPPVTFRTQLTFLGLGLGASAVLLAAATWRVRSVVIGQLGRGEGARRRRSWSVWPSPALDRNPVLWRECRRKSPSGWSLLIWGVYVLIFGGFSVYAVYGMSERNLGRREMGAVINTMQVALGLLLLSVTAATSLAEERQRGSLDVLMATPLSTFSIVWGKWWGAFRAVPPLLALPMVVTTALAYHSGHSWAVLLMGALILAYGAAITSLGLALATWVPRLGRAVGLTVGCYVGMTLGWIPLAFYLFGDAPGNDGPGVAAGSPITGIGIFGLMLAENGSWPDLAGQSIWMLFWIAAYGLVALGLLLATLGTFNRCLGRVDADRFLD